MMVSHIRGRSRSETPSCPPCFPDMSMSKQHAGRRYPSQELCAPYANPRHEVHTLHDLWAHKSRDDS